MIESGTKALAPSYSALPSEAKGAYDAVVRATPGVTLNTGQTSPIGQAAAGIIDGVAANATATSMQKNGGHCSLTIGCE